MKKYKLVLSFLSLAVITILFNSCGGNNSGYNPPPGGANDMVITIPSGAMGRGTSAYGANPLHVPVGTKVVWYNSDSMTHTSTSDTSVWDTGNLPGGSTSGQVLFTTPGTYPYHCNIHGSASMSGTIIVP